MSEDLPTLAEAQLIVKAHQNPKTVPGALDVEQEALRLAALAEEMGLPSGVEPLGFR